MAVSVCNLGEEDEDDRSPELASQYNKNFKVPGLVKRCCFMKQGNT